MTSIATLNLKPTSTDKVKTFERKGCYVTTAQKADIDAFKKLNGMLERDSQTHWAYEGANGAFYFVNRTLKNKETGEYIPIPINAEFFKHFKHSEISSRTVFYVNDDVSFTFEQNGKMVPLAHPMLKIDEKFDENGEKSIAISTFTDPQTHSKLITYAIHKCNITYKDMKTTHHKCRFKDDHEQFSDESFEEKKADVVPKSKEFVEAVKKPEVVNETPLVKPKSQKVSALPRPVPKVEQVIENKPNPLVFTNIPQPVDVPKVPINLPIEDKSNVIEVKPTVIEVKSNVIEENKVISSVPLNNKQSTKFEILSRGTSISAKVNAPNFDITCIDGVLKVSSNYGADCEGIAKLLHQYFTPTVKCEEVPKVTSKITPTTRNWNDYPEDSVYEVSDVE